MSSRIPLPDTCEVGQHEPCIMHRSGGASAKVRNVCGKCGRFIERISEEGGKDDPWMTEEQHKTAMLDAMAEEPYESREEHEGDYHKIMDDRCPPRE